jgi:hypothetical protein
MSIRGNGQNKKRIVCYLPPKLARMADQLADQRLTSVSSMIRSHLFDEVLSAVATGELVSNLSSPSAVKGSSTGQQMSAEEMATKLETGEVSFNDPQVAEWLDQNGYTLQKQAPEQDLVLNN